MISIEGYSGCGIRVFRNPDKSKSDYILEKSTDKGSYVPRLLLQQKKQAEFLLFNKLPHVLVPNTLYIRQHTEERLDTTPAPPLVQLSCAVGMNFLHHTDALSFLAKATVDDVRSFANTLNSVLEQYVQASPLSPVPVSTFAHKLTDIRRLCFGNSNICQDDKTFVCDDVIPALLASLQASAKKTQLAVVDKCSSSATSDEALSITLPVGMCHGDLTLSNILIAHKDDDDLSSLAPEPVACAAVSSSETYTKIVLIDFLDSFIESPLADMAKLCQDLKFAWTIRVSHQQTATLDTVHFFTVLSYLHRAMEERFQAYAWYREYLSLMLIINQLRVLQYSKDPHAARYLATTVRDEYAEWSARVLYV